jgi:hypothetical protein
VGYWSNDGFARSLKRLFSVIPAQAGIQSFHVVRIFWIPVFTGMTTICEVVNNGFFRKKLFFVVPSSAICSPIIPSFHYSNVPGLFYGG